jgi:glucose/arabinose dehydrogenase
MFTRGTRSAAVAVAVAATVVVVAVAEAAGGPPAPKAFGGAKVSLFATGLKNPTSFAFGDGAMFAGDSGSSNGPPNGGVYVIRNGNASEIPNSPLFVGGMTFHDGALYLSGGFAANGAPSWQIAKWSGWNGTTFASRKTVYTAPKGFQGFNGIAFGPDGRLYVGVDAGLLNGNDHGPASRSPYLYDVLSMNTKGKGLKVFARGMRQPWQMAFAKGSKAPFVSDLGQDGPKTVKNPPDFVLKVSAGDNYGFPKCNWTKGSNCTGYARPFKQFSPHADIMGLAIIGRTLYLGSFLGAGGKSGGALYSMPVAGGTVKRVVTGFPAATDALAADGGYLYVGGSTQAGAGLIWRVKP